MRRETLSYDRRERGTAVETRSRRRAATRLFVCKAIVERQADRSLDEPMFVHRRCRRRARRCQGWSTLGRELAFVVASHRSPPGDHRAAAGDPGYPGAAALRVRAVDACRAAGHAAHGLRPGHVHRHRRSPRGDGFRLVCNRDERLARPLALSPGLHRRAVAPRSSRSIRSAAAHGSASTTRGSRWRCSIARWRWKRRLPTFAPAQPRPDRPAMPSADAVSDALTIVHDVGGRAVLRRSAWSSPTRHRVGCAVSDDRELSIKRLSSRRPLLFTSSSLGDEAGRGAPPAAVRAAAGKERAGWLDGQFRFHRTQWTARPDISVLMERLDAGTVSRSVVDVSPRRSRFGTRRCHRGRRRRRPRDDGIAHRGGAGLGTLASEDLACVAAGLLIARAELGGFPGVAGCTLGILLGDVGLWAVGRFGAVALEWRWVARLAASALAFAPGSIAMPPRRSSAAGSFPALVCRFT